MILLGLVFVGSKAKERFDADHICGFSSSCVLAGEVARTDRISLMNLVLNIVVLVHTAS